jgi:hypothetical protein
LTPWQQNAALDGHQVAVNEVFVAMSFDTRFDERWAKIFMPAIEEKPIGGVSLRAVRVDIHRSGESILTEIADGRSRAASSC